MAPTSNTPPDGVSQHMHDVITGEGFTYKVDYRRDIDTIREDDHHVIQIRAETEPNKPHVRKLTEAIRAGAKIDLIAVTEDGYRVYGNHRFPAYKAIGLPQIPVIVIGVKAAEADEDVLRRLRIIGFRENAHHGLPNSKRTNEMAVVDFRADGWDNARIARELGVSANRVADIVAVDKGNKALGALGITTPLTKTVIGAIGRVSEDMNREPFVQLVKLVADADLNKTEINTLAKAVKEAGSDVDAVAIIDAERLSLRSRVSGSDNAGRPSFAAQLRQKMGFIVGKAGNEQVLVEGSTGLAAEHLKMVNESIRVLTIVRDLMVETHGEQEDAA